MPYLTYHYGDATKIWYDEIQFYDYTTHKSIDPSDKNKQVGHFTCQMWKTLSSVGFGFYAGPRKYDQAGSGPVDIQELYVVANYYPTPNIIGAFQQNVVPPL